MEEWSSAKPNKFGLWRFRHPGFPGWAYLYFQDDAGKLEHLETFVPESRTGRPPVGLDGGEWLFISDNRIDIAASLRKKYGRWNVDRSA